MIYMDNASTTRPTKMVIDAIGDALLTFGNPSSLHGLGIMSEKMIDNSKQIIADKLACDKKNLFFTSGGTEANNMAILGYARANIKRGKHLITTKIEHPSVLESFKTLENEGFDVTYLNVGQGGRIDIDELKSAITPKTTLISVMLVNNETGVIQPVSEIKALKNNASPICAIHCDCVQAFGKLDFTVKSLGADIITISGHKIHGPKGIGAIYLANNKISPIIHGGEQQLGIRPGTENTSGIVGFGTAALQKNIDCSTVYDALKKGILENIDNVLFNGTEEFSSKTVLNVSFLGLKAEVLLHTLENYGIYVSTGSACSSHKPQPSHVLVAMGADKTQTNGAIRFSFCEENTVEETKLVVDALKKEVPILRKYMR